MKSLVLTFILFISGCSTVFSLDTIQNSRTVNGEPKRDFSFPIRGGIGSQGMLVLFFPTDINTYIKDLNVSIKNEFAMFISSNESHTTHWGYGYSLNAEIRVYSLIQLEPYWERFYSFPLQISYETLIGVGKIDATYKFQLSSDEKGVSLLLVPGSKKRNIFLTLGAGFGILNGQFSQSITGDKWLNGIHTKYDNTTTYKGSANAYHGTVGLTFVPWHYLEVEVLLNGKYSLIKTLKDETGATFTNVYRDNEPVSLNFSGVDLRIGCKFIFP
jgi:hypothetical protein